MQLQQYRDDFIERETGGRYGHYVSSYRYAGGLVDVHFFEAPDGTSTALLTVSPGFPQSVAEQVVRAAFDIDHARRGARVVLNPNSLPRTGSY